MERRRHRRFNVKSAKAEYSRGTSVFNLLKKDIKPGQRAAIRNLSLGGLQLLSAEKIEAGTKLHLTIDIPCVPEPLRFRGQVRWLKLLEGRALYCIGIQFNRTPPDYERLARELANDPTLREMQRN